MATADRHDGADRGVRAAAGGAFRISLTDAHADAAPRGKTSEHSDTVDGRFLEIEPDSRIVQAFRFESDDPGSPARCG